MVWYKKGRLKVGLFAFLRGFLQFFFRIFEKKRNFLGLSATYIIEAGDLGAALSNKHPGRTDSRKTLFYHLQFVMAGPYGPAIFVPIYVGL
jgi:hypothetical protein